MQPEQIKKFYAAREEYFKKKDEITKAMYDLSILLEKANAELRLTVDNGFENDYLVKVADAYSKHMFNSKIVQDFLSKVDAMFLSGIDKSLKDNLEVTTLQIECFYGDLSYNDSKIKGRIASPVIVKFTNQRYSFNLSIPIRSAVSADMVNWHATGIGLYRVDAHLDTSSNEYKKICWAFDTNKVGIAIERLLKGELDNELDADMSYCIKSYVNSNSWKRHLSMANHLRLALHDDDYMNDTEFIDVHDIFNHKNGFEDVSLVHQEDCIMSCIDDREDYISTCK